MHCIPPPQRNPVRKAFFFVPAFLLPSPACLSDTNTRGGEPTRVWTYNSPRDTDAGRGGPTIKYAHALEHSDRSVSDAMGGNCPRTRWPSPDSCPPPPKKKQRFCPHSRRCQVCLSGVTRRVRAGLVCVCWSPMFSASTPLRTAVARLVCSVKQACSNDARSRPKLHTISPDFSISPSTLSLS